MMSQSAFRSRRVVTPEGQRPATVFVDDGRILRIADHDAATSGYSLTDFGDMALLPGLVDTHVHINEPGRTEWEGFSTATRAAAAGGITTLVDMPLNCLPETTTVAALEAKRTAALGKTLVDWAAWGGAVADNQQHLQPLVAAGVPGFKCFLVYPGIDGFTMINQQQLRAVLPHIAQSGLPLLVHAELAGPLEDAAKKLNNVDWREYATYLASRPDEAEIEAIKLMIQLCEEYLCRIHIVHLATAKALPLLREARAKGLPITVETCPHYLYFAAEDIPAGATEFKCAPPIRSRANNEGLWQGLREGVIDLVATDHSPCPLDMKGRELGDFGKAWGGIASLSVALPAMWTAARRHGFELTHLAQWMSAAPAALAGLADRKGRIAAGLDADFVVFDPEAEFTVTTDDLHFRHPVSPYLGERLTGRVLGTWLRGENIYSMDRDGFFSKSVVGRELRLGA
jgi:allantoinase